MLSTFGLTDVGEQKRILGKYTVYDERADRAKEMNSSPETKGKEGMQMRDVRKGEWVGACTRR